MNRKAGSNDPAFLFMILWRAVPEVIEEAALGKFTPVAGFIPGALFYLEWALNLACAALKSQAKKTL